MLKQNKLAVAIAAVLASAMTQANAQDASANTQEAKPQADTKTSSDDGLELGEIVVTGLRASLTSAMEIKKNAAGIVDAINAEDIGKFPDTNLAESLQRITGVSIDRRNG